MKKQNTFLAMFLLAIAGCDSNKPSTDALITIDVTANYSKKELILQDILDVEYIPMETTNDFITQGIVLAVGKEIILVKNQINDGIIFVFDRNGKGLRKINRMGRGSEEYYRILEVMLDEGNNEIFVNGSNGIFVYDLYGNFKRRFQIYEKGNYRFLQNFNREHLICKESIVGEIRRNSTESLPLIVASKSDGSVVKDIQFHFKEGVNTIVELESGYIAPRVNSIIPYRDSWLLTESSSDTIFKLMPDFTLTPFIARIPSIHAMNSKIFLYPVLLTENYYFMESLKREYDFDSRSGFPRKKLMYDIKEKKTYEYVIYNGDYSTKKDLDISISTRVDEIAFWQKIEAFELVESNKKGELKGKLKEIAENLKEDDNPVIMLVKYKK